MANIFVEYAASGRSGCRGCKEKIGKGEVRIGDKGSGGAPHFKYKPGMRRNFVRIDYFHLKCAPAWLSELSANNVRGLGTLQLDDQKAVKGLLQTAAPIKTLSSTGMDRACPGLKRRKSSQRVEELDDDEELRFEVPTVAKADEILRRKCKLSEKQVSDLMAFQRQGVAYAITTCKGRVLIGDEMGLGKTVQAIMFLKAYEREWPALIVTPSSVKLNWADELEKWLPDLEPGCINIVKDRTFPGNLNAQITIVTYGMFTKSSKVCQLIADKKFKVVVLDESHYIKSHNATRTKLLVPIISDAKRAALLSGTPALARPVELWPQINALRNDLFPKWFKFVNTYCGPRRMPWGTDYTGATNLEELNSLLRRFMVRRLKKQVLTQLPAKRRQLVRLDIPDRELNKVKGLMERLKGVDLGSIMRAYDDGSGDFAEAIGARKEQREVLTKLYKETGLAKTAAGGKYITEMLEDVENTPKLIVFAHHHDVLDSLETTLTRTKIKLVRIDGRTPSKLRHDNVKAFQDDSSGVRVALLGLTSAGQGITLTKASKVIFAEMNWTPGVLIQAEDRAHRIGQTCAVNVYYLRAKGSLDDIVWGMVCRKLDTVGQALDGTNRVKMHADRGGNENRDGQAQNRNHHLPDQSDDEDDAAAAIKAFPPGDMRGWLQNRSLVQASSSSTSSKRPLAKTPFSLSQRKGSTEAPCSNPSAPLLASQVLDLSDSRQSFDDGERDEVQTDSEPKRRKTSLSPRVSRSVEASSNAMLDLTTGEDSNLSFTTPATKVKATKSRFFSLDDSEQSNNENMAPWHSHQAQPRSAPNFTVRGKSKTPSTMGQAFCGKRQSLNISSTGRADACKAWPNAEDGQKEKPRVKPLKMSFTAAYMAKSKANLEDDEARPTCDASIEDIEDSDSEKAVDSPTIKTKPGYKGLYFRVSGNTGRIFLYDNDQKSLSVNLSLDEIDSIGGQNGTGPVLSPTVLAIENAIKSLKAFAKQWRALRGIERKELSGEIVRPPVLSELQRLRAIKHACQSQGSDGQAAMIPGQLCFERYASLDADSTSLAERCMVCTQSVPKMLLDLGVSGICSRECYSRRAAKLGSSAIRRQLFELECGICQLCGVDAQALYERVKAVTPPERYQKLVGTNFRADRQLLENPTAGGFWQADHIVAVSLGGGHAAFSDPMQNLRTLCTPCHEKETAKLRRSLKEISDAREAAGTRDIRSFFGDEASKSNKKSVVIDIID